MKGIVWLLGLGLLFSVVVKGQDAAEEPDINQFIFVEKEAKPLNMNEVVQTIGYPDSAQAKGIEGRVVARILVDTEGNYVKHQITGNSDSLLVTAVEEHIHELTFEPAFNKGEPLLCWINVPFTFRLEQKSPQERAIDYLTQVMEEKGESYQAYLQRGLQYLELGQFTSAKADFTKSLAINGVPEAEPDTGKSFRMYAHYGKAKALSSEEQWQEAFADLSSAITIAESGDETDTLMVATLPNIYSDRGFVQFAQLNYDEALADYQKAMELGPENSCELYNLSADVYIAQNRFKELVDTYDKLIICKPEDKFLHYSRGFYRMELGNNAGAVEDFRKAATLNLDPNIRIAALNSSSEANLKDGNYEEALKDLEASLVINVLNAKTYLQRAKVYEAMENMEGRCADLKKAMDYGLEDQDADAAKEVATKLEGCE